MTAYLRRKNSECSLHPSTKGSYSNCAYSDNMNKIDKGYVCYLPCQSPTEGLWMRLEEDQHPV